MAAPAESAAEPALVLLHPFPFDSRVFDGLREELARELPEISVLTPDLRGAGTPTLDTLADQVVALLDAQGLATAVVGGVSMGGYVALNLLRRHPGRLAGLVLIDTKAEADTPAALANRFGMAERADSGVRPVAAELLAGMISVATLRDRTAVVARLTSIIDAQPVESIAWNQRAMAGRPDSTAALRDADLRVLVVVGADDAITPPGPARRMALDTGQSILIEVPDTGHLAVAEDPSAVAGAIRTWWAAAR